MPVKKMKKEKKEKDCCDVSGYNYKPSCGCGGFAYITGVIGSAIYYISNANGFWMGVLGLLKSLVWPVFLVYELLKFIGA